MAYLKFDRLAGEGKEDPGNTLHYISNILLVQRSHIKNDPWRGLPELTNHSTRLSDSVQERRLT